MQAAMVDLGANEFLVAVSAPELLQTGKHLPKDVLPGYLFLSQEHYEFVNVPMFVILMFGDNVSMEVNEYIGFGAVHPFALHICVQRITIDTAMKHIVLLFEEILQLLHK